MIYEIVFFDTETTGTEFKLDVPIENRHQPWSMFFLKTFYDTEKECFVVNPNNNKLLADGIDLKLKVNIQPMLDMESEVKQKLGLTPQKLKEIQNQQDAFKNHIDEINQFIDGSILVAFNGLVFDRLVMQNEYLQLNQNFYDKFDRFFDPMMYLIANQKDFSELRNVDNFRLETMFSEFIGDLTQTHDSKDDVLMMFEIVKKIIERQGFKEILNFSISSKFINNNINMFDYPQQQDFSLQLHKENFVNGDYRLINNFFLERNLMNKKNYENSYYGIDFLKSFWNQQDCVLSKKTTPNGWVMKKFHIERIYFLNLINYSMMYNKKFELENNKIQQEKQKEINNKIQERTL